MATSPTRLMTFEEFERLDWPKAGSYELHHGELIRLPPAEYDHFLIQQRLRDLLDRAAAGRGRAYTESAYRAILRGEYRIADVAYCSNQKWEENETNRYFTGAPDLVVEVLSPSNTAAQIADTRELCFEHGCREFWVVDPRRQRIEVFLPRDAPVAYQAGDRISTHFGAEIEISERVFARRR